MASTFLTFLPKRSASRSSSSIPSAIRLVRSGVSALTTVRSARSHPVQSWRNTCEVMLGAAIEEWSCGSTRASLWTYHGSFLKSVGAKGDPALPCSPGILLARRTASLALPNRNCPRVRQVS